MGCSSCGRRYVTKASGASPMPAVTQSPTLPPYPPETNGNGSHQGPPGAFNITPIVPQPEEAAKSEENA